MSKIQKGQTLLLSTPMPRLTIALEDRDHLALRLLALRDGKRLNEVVDEAVKRYLESAGAYTLRISDSETNP